MSKLSLGNQSFYGSICTSVVLLVGVVATVVVVVRICGAGTSRTWIALVQASW